MDLQHCLAVFGSLFHSKPILLSDSEGMLAGVCPGILGHDALHLDFVSHSCETPLLSHQTVAVSVQWTCSVPYIIIKKRWQWSSVYCPLINYKIVQYFFFRVQNLLKSKCWKKGHCEVRYGTQLSGLILLLFLSWGQRYVSLRVKIGFVFFEFIRFEFVFLKKGITTSFNF
jgi:hypothetical protein